MNLCQHLRRVLASALAFGLGPVLAIDLATQDGLCLRLDAATGAVQAVVVGGNDVPLLPGVPGGPSFVEWHYREAAATRPVAVADFETAAGWQPVASANWQSADRIAAEVRTDGGALGSRSYARLGNPGQYGHGIGFAEPVPVTAGNTYSISWQARVPSSTATYIVYLRLYDADGREVTTASPPPRGWAYSPYTQTHFEYLIGAPETGVWTAIRRAYRVPEGVAALRLALCLWRGDHVDADCLEVAPAAGPAPSAAVSVRGPLLPLADGQGWRQQLTAVAPQLEFQVTYQAAADHLRVDVDLHDTSQPRRDRALEVRYHLPVHLEGWQWHDDIRRQRQIAGVGGWRCDFSYEGHAVSRYPFSCVTGAAAGLALGVPPDMPMLESRSYRAGRGFGLSADFGLSPLSPPDDPGRARFAFVLYATDPRWGFRAAAARYYDLFPEAFHLRAQRQGCWLWPVAPDEIPQAEDFGLTFWESSAAKPENLEAARRLGIYVLHYIEPCGLRQWFPEIKGDQPMYTPPECLDRLRALAADTAATAKWSGGPQAEVAQAVLNALPERADGSAPFHASNGYGAWAQWWFTNPSPYLPAPNRGTTCRQYEITPALVAADGIYVDSVGLETLRYEDYRPAHLAAARTALTFSFETGRPCLPGALPFHDFLAWMATDLHAQGKLVMLNIGADPPAYRFYAHSGDVLGCEVGSSGNPKNRQLAQVENDEVCSLRRTYAYRRPTANLLQEGNYTTPAPALTRAEVEQYIKQQLFYGFYPGISTIGGEEKPGYASWKRYFRSPEQFERDRDLFRTYIPVIRRLNAAGWEPVTGAWTSRPEVAIERFGRGLTGGLYFTLRNLSEAPRTATVRVDTAPVAAGDAVPARRIMLTDVLSGQTVAVRAAEGLAVVEFELSLAGHDTQVVSLGSPSAP